MAQHAESDKRPKREARAQVVGIVANVVRWIGLLCAIVLVVHVVLTVGSANPANGITTFFADLARPLAVVPKYQEEFHN